MNAIRDHLRKRLSLIRKRSMFHVKLSVAEMACLQCALNEMIGQALDRLRVLPDKLGQDSATAQELVQGIIRGDQLYAKLVEADWKTERVGS